MSRAEQFPLGAELTISELSADPHAALARLRQTEPVSWVPALDGWLVTRRDLCLEVMRNPTLFTVDDPRFSTAQVVGPSMLSLDGTEHRRHRDPFAEALRLPAIRAQFLALMNERARGLLLSLPSEVELRTQLAGPLAVQVMIDVIGLIDTDPNQLLSWYRAIVEAVNMISAGSPAGMAALEAMEELAEKVQISTDGSRLLGNVSNSLDQEAVVSNSAVMFFGGIETAEGMTSNALWFLLSERSRWEQLLARPDLVSLAIEESLRLEPAAGRVDRYATEPIDLAGAAIGKRDLVVVSLTAANRDPDVYGDPDQFNPGRDNVRSHLAFAQGPHACIGIHLARYETAAALESMMSLVPEVHLDREQSTSPSGLVFRKPDRLVASLG